MLSFDPITVSLLDRVAPAQPCLVELNADEQRWIGHEHGVDCLSRGTTEFDGSTELAHFLQS
jgi:hypothetical protein